MKKLKVADLYCGAGGASMGLHRAGFEVEGWDVNHQKNYPFKFNLGNALEADLSGFDLIWASPPCQAYAQAALSQRNKGKVYPDLMASTREKLMSSRIPFIIENVVGAPMRNDVMLCGSMFGLRLVRHRIFELGIKVQYQIPVCNHPEVSVCVVGHGTPTWSRKNNGGKCFTIQDCRDAMGIHWMNRGELSQAIPPAYSEFLSKPIFDILCN